MFTDAFSKDHQLIRADPKHSLYLACALMVRGNVQVSDLRRNIERWDPERATRIVPPQKAHAPSQIFLKLFLYLETSKSRIPETFLFLEMLFDLGEIKLIDCTQIGPFKKN